MKITRVGASPLNSVVPPLPTSCGGHAAEPARNDEIDLEGIRELSPEGILLGPGPGGPEEAGITLACIERFGESIPIRMCLHSTPATKRRAPTCVN